MAHSEIGSFQGLAFAQARKAVRSGTATPAQQQLYEMHQLGHQAARIHKPGDATKKVSGKKMLDEVSELNRLGDWRCKNCSKVNHSGHKGEVVCQHCHSKFNFVASTH